MKLSFSVQSKSNSKSNPIRPSNKFDADAATDTKGGNSSAREYVTEFDASKSSSDPSKSTMVIPPIENEWNIGRSHKRMKNLDSPITESNGGTEVGFELDTSTVVEPGSDMSYGLNLRQTKKNDGDGEKHAGGSGGDGGGGDNHERSRSVSLDSVKILGPANFYHSLVEESGRRGERKGKKKKKQRKGRTRRKMKKNKEEKKREKRKAQRRK